MFEWGDRWDTTGGFYVGVADRVVLKRGNGLSVGYVGFWEIDDMLPDGYEAIVRGTGRPAHLFTTERGFHFLCLEVMTLAEKLRWRDTMVRMGGDYPLFKENCLRISAKNGKKPKYAFTINETTAGFRNYSSYHVRAYRPLFGIHGPTIIPKFHQIRTYGHLFLYYADPSGVIESALKHDVRRITGVGGR